MENPSEALRKAVIAGRLLRVTGRIEREGQIVHLIAKRIEDLSPMLSSLGQAVDTNRRPGSTRPSARHPREQARSLFPSRDFH